MKKDGDNGNPFPTELERELFRKAGEGEAVGRIVRKGKLFRVTLEVKTIVHRFVVHDDAIEAGRQAAAAEGLGAFGEGVLSSVTPIEVRDITNSALYGAFTGEGETK